MQHALSRPDLPIPRQRVPNGIDKRRPRVDLTPEMLAQVEALAARQQRSLSAMVGVLVAERLSQLSDAATASASCESGAGA